MSISKICLIGEEDDLDIKPTQAGILFISDPDIRVSLRFQGPFLHSAFDDIKPRDKDWLGEVTMSMLDDELPEKRPITDHQARQIINWADNLHRRTEMYEVYIVCAGRERSEAVGKVLAMRYGLKSAYAINNKAWAPVRTQGNKWVRDQMLAQHNRRSFSDKYGKNDEGE